MKPRVMRGFISNGQSLASPGVPRRSGLRVINDSGSGRSTWNLSLSAGVCAEFTSSRNQVRRWLSYPIAVVVPFSISFLIRRLHYSRAALFPDYGIVSRQYIHEFIESVPAGNEEWGQSCPAIFGNGGSNGCPGRPG
jgi:hypothetical protein